MRNRQSRYFLGSLLTALLLLGGFTPALAGAAKDAPKPKDAKEAPKPKEAAKTAEAPKEAKKVPAEAKKEEPKKDAPKKDDAKKDGDKKDAKPAGKDNAGAEDATDELINKKAKQKGPTFPGDDPAFLVLPRPTERSKMCEELLTDEVKVMIDRALKYLVLTQDADGGWSDKDFPSNTGVTALACMGFMADGSRPRIGIHGKQIARGLEFLLKNVQTSGVIVGKGANKLGPMYEHMMSTLCLLLAFGDAPWETQARSTIERAIEVMHQSQRLDGGWRYSYSSEGQSDISCTANALWVLRTAKKSGFTVSQKTIDKGLGFVEGCALPDGTFRYRYWGLHANPSMGGTGVIALCNNGNIDHVLIPTARDRIAYDYRRYTVKDILGREYFIYGCFYASLAMYTMGDSYFIPWYKKMVQILNEAKRKDGEFADHKENTVYVTSMAVIALQAPYGYLPIYER